MFISQYIQHIAPEIAKSSVHSSVSPAKNIFTMLERNKKHTYIDMMKPMMQTDPWYDPAAELCVSVSHGVLMA